MIFSGQSAQPSKEGLRIKRSQPHIDLIKTVMYCGMEEEMEMVYKCGRVGREPS